MDSRLHTRDGLYEQGPKIHDDFASTWRIVVIHSPISEHEQRVPDRDVLLQRDAEGKTLWVLHTGKGTVIEEAP